MGYWSNTMERYKIRDRSMHPWAELLRGTLANVEPESFAELETTGELNAYLSVKVDECIQSIRTMQKQGMDYQTAKECAFDAMLPKAEQAVAEDWEDEGALADMTDAFSDWIGNARSTTDMEG